MGVTLVVSGAGYSQSFFSDNADELIAKAEALRDLKSWAGAREGEVLGEIAAKEEKERGNAP